MSLTAKAGTEVILSEAGYIFDGSGGKRDLLEQTILNEFENKEYPFKVTIQEGKSSGFSRAREQCVNVVVDDHCRVVIANKTIGTYLYVKVYLLRRLPPVTITLTKNSPTIPASMLASSMFYFLDFQAAYTTAIAICESAFSKLELKQINSGYHPIVKESNRNSVI